MKIDELHKLIRRHPACEVDCIGWYSLGGCELLECISDVDGFVELLGKFLELGDWLSESSSSFKDVSFVDGRSDPIRVILYGDVDFVAAHKWVDIYVKTYMWQDVHNISGDLTKYLGLGVIDYRCLL